ncbi:MAG TPA: hypothetical protein VFP72_23995 [Kineosporiaceae bacterium]|nr:hypothetical protein [Kineosporiaceae bacterium]
MAGRFSPFRTGDASHPRARAQRLEVLIGILAFFTSTAAVRAVTYALRGRSATWPALVLLGLAVARGLAVGARRRTGI